MGKIHRIHRIVERDFRNSLKESEGEGYRFLQRFRVSTAARENGIGSKLPSHLAEQGYQSFDQLGLRIDSATADIYYCANGFERIKEQPAITRRLEVSAK